MINLEWFRTFSSIYEVGTLSGAAQSLGMSQPGVSLQLNSLESFMGYRLFERETRRVVPTERGTMLYNYIVDAIGALEEIEKQFQRTAKSSRPTISIGMCLATFQQTLEKEIAELPFNLITRFGEYEQLIADLNNGAVDFVLAPQQIAQPGIHYKPFLKERIVLICGSKTDHTILDQHIALDDRDEIRNYLKDQAWFATSVDMAYLTDFWMANFNSAPDFKPSYVIPNYSSILTSLRNAEGFTVIPGHLCVKDVAAGYIKIVWEGSPYLENTLHFGQKKKTNYPVEIQHLEDLVAKNWFS